MSVLHHKMSKYINLDYFLYFFILLICFIFFIKTGPIYYPDSDGYLNMWLIRSIGYTLFIAFFKLVFGENYIPFLLFAQFLLCISSCLYLTKCIQKTIQLNKWLLLVIFGFLIVPIVYEINVSNSILSESLAYPLYLFIVGNLLLIFVNNQIKNYYFLFLLTYLLILVRGQFLFIVPVLIIGILILAFKNGFTKKSGLLILLAFLIPILAITTDVIFHKIAHNKAIETPWTGIQMATLPFFVADKNDVVLFDSKVEQDYFNHIYKKIQDKKIALNQLHPEQDPTDFYFTNYTTICNKTLNDDGLLFFDSKLSTDEKIIQNEKITAAIAIPLLKDNFKKWFGIYIQNVSKGFGSSKMMLLYAIIFCLSLFVFIKKEKRISLFIVMPLLLLFGNVFLVALVEPVLSRYTFYNNWILITIVLFLFQNTFLKNADE